MSYLQLQAQKINIGVSVNSIIDYKWMKPLRSSHEKLFVINTFGIESRIPLSFSILVEKQNFKISPSVGFNFIQRNMVFSQFYVDNGTYTHQTFEVPVNFTKRKSISNDASLILNLGGGGSYILAENVFFLGGGIDPNSNSWQLMMINRKNIAGFVNAGIGIENKIGSSGILQIKFQYVYYLSPNISYRSYINSGFVGEINPFNINYATFGVTYFPNFSKKIKSNLIKK